MKNRVHSIILCMVLVGAVMLVGCSGQDEPQAERQGGHESMEQMESRSSGTMAQAKDPVCGMTVSTASTHNATYEGKTYYFCASGCKDKFVENPQQYLSQ